MTAAGHECLAQQLDGSADDHSECCFYTHTGYGFMGRPLWGL